ncbi:MAG: HpcH/HpaI aldolase family protein [Limisphaerales bacterium]
MKTKSSHSALPGKNPLKEQLLRGESAIGVLVTVNNVEVAARMAGLGFDFLWIETEHSPLSLETVRNIVLATRGQHAIPLARPPINELWTAKRLLDMGVLGVIFPFTRSVELARQTVAACRYPPIGLRGSGADLARLRWSEPENYYDFADENVLVVAMIEDVQGLSCIDQIAAVPGIDVIFIGTSDLSFSLGLRGEQHHARLNAAVAKIAAAVKRHGKILGRPARTPAEVRLFQAQGFRFFMTGSELDLLEAGARQFLKPLGRGPWR